MKIGRTGIALIKSFESLRLEAYRCPAGVWTIGYGHTAGVRQGAVVDELRAEYLLAEDLKKFEDAVSRDCHGLNQNQFDALVSFSFNVGTGNFRKSTLLKCVKANPGNQNIRYEFSRWNKANGTVLAGLVRRRKAEADLYFS